MTFFVLPFEPIACPRPKVTRYGTFYNKNYTAFKMVVGEWLDGKKFAMMEGPLEVELTFKMPIPKSFSKKKHSELDGKAHTQKGDIDNLCKSVFDVLQGRLFNDDSQICVLKAKKTWVDGPGHMTIKIVSYEDE